MWHDLDHGLTILALVLFVVALVQLTLELTRRTRHWNGLSKSLTTLIGVIALIFLWFLLGAFGVRVARAEMRLGLTIAGIIACLNSIHHVRKLPPRPWHWRWHDPTTETEP